MNFIDKQKKMERSIAMKQVWIASALLLLTACNGKNQTETNVVEGNDSTAVEITDSVKDAEQVDAVTSATSVEKSPTYNGVIDIAPQQRATVSLTMGGKIASLNIRPGIAVTKGQVIANMENPEYIELQQNFLEADAQTEFLALEHERQKTLNTQNAASQKKLEESKAMWLSMKSKRDAAAARLSALGIAPQLIKEQGIRAFLPIKAPISGYVTDMKVNIGSYLQMGDAICNIINKSQPMIILTVYEKDIKQMEVGTQLAFRANGMGKTSFHATVINVEQRVDAQDYSIKVYASVSTPNTNFRPGMYVRARKSK